MQINLSVQSLCSHTLHNDLLGRVMYDTDIIKADLAHFSSGKFVYFATLCCRARNQCRAILNQPYHTELWVF